MRIGLIARSDRTGLGNQTRNLARMLRPDEVLLIDSSPFNGNAQDPDMYAQYTTTRVLGFPTDAFVENWLRGLDVVLTCEIFYNNNFVDIAKRVGVKTINQYNWEFADYLRNEYLTVPDKLVSPSSWHLDEARQKWGNVEQLATPVFTDDYKDVRESNMKRTGPRRFLHIMGRQAVNDRNGTADLIRAMMYSEEEYELVIKVQSATDVFLPTDRRVVIDTFSPENEVDLYRDFDALILPRRYGGQCLPMNEALCAGLPVIMTDISPNNDVLPSQWLAPAHAAGRFMTRTWIDLATVNHEALGMRLDFFAQKDLHIDKEMAYNIGYTNYSNYELEKKWEKLIEDTCSR